MSTKQALAELTIRTDELAAHLGDEMQRLESLIAGSPNAGTLRRVEPPNNDTSAGAVGDVATDGEYAYFYLGNGTTHKWGQSLLITQFTR